MKPAILALKLGDISTIDRTQHLKADRTHKKAPSTSRSAGLEFYQII
jgi:hypothetical protein